MTLEKKQIAGKTIGFTATVTCDAPFGWSEERTATVTTDINKVFDTSQEIGYIIPNTVVTALSDGDVRIYKLTIIKVSDTTSISDIISNLSVKVSGSVIYNISPNTNAGTLINSINKYSAGTTVTISADIKLLKLSDNYTDNNYSSIYLNSVSNTANQTEKTNQFLTLNERVRVYQTYFVKKTDNYYPVSGPIATFPLIFRIFRRLKAALLLLPFFRIR